MQKINRNHRLNFDGGASSGFVPETAVNTVYLAKPAPLFVSYDGGAGELIGYGHEFKFELDDIEGARIWAPVQGVAIVKPRYVYEPQGEVYTNFDKRPTLSPLEQSVTLALRKLKQEQRQLAAERAAIDRKMVEEKELETKNPPPAPEPEQGPDEAPTPPPEPTPTA